MKVLIVDDERHVIVAIELLVDWKEIGFDQVITSSDSTEALELIKSEHPDLVLTDMMMPEVHGTELVEAIASFDKNIKIIVISGYSDFDYIQHTLRHGGTDYITKPIKEKQLVDAVAKAIADIKEVKQIKEVRKQVWRRDPIFWDQVFNEVLENGRLSQEQIAGIKDEFSLEEGMPVTIGKLALFGLDILKEKAFSNDEKLMIFALRNVCMEVISASVMKGYVTLQMDEEMRMTLVLWGKAYASMMVLKNIELALQNLYSLDTVVGVSNSRLFPSYMPLALEEAKEGLMSLDLMSKNPGIRVYTCHTEKFIYQLDHRQVLKYIEYNNEDYLKEHIRDLVREITDLNIMTLRELIAIRMEMQRVLSYCSSQLSVESAEMSQMEQYWFNPRIPEYLCREFIYQTRVLLKSWKRKNKQAQDLMAAIRDYIDSHYSAYLSLEVLSTEFGMSREHISRKFKQRLNRTVNNYITEVRMKEAKALLQGTELSIKDLAIQMGYEDEKYFSKVFKKTYGMTPAGFRKL